jgi:DNA (cytosine-5)-methyltransferase 1
MTPTRVAALAGGTVDILLGCPPCQGFSDTGTRDPNDARNSHMDRFSWIASRLKPLAVAMENVPLAAEGPQFSRLISRMERAGYVWTAGILNSALYGSTQTRQRLVYVAIRADVGSEPVLPHPTHGGSGLYYSYSSGRLETIATNPVAMLGRSPGTTRLSSQLTFEENFVGPSPIPTVGATLAGLPRIGTREALALNHFPWAHTRGMLQRMTRVREGGRWRGGADHYSQSYGRLHRRGLARTITTFFPNAGSGRFWHPVHNRALTLREAARIQGFPDTFRFLPPFSQAATLVGNALDASLAELTYACVRACLE